MEAQLLFIGLSILLAIILSRGILKPLKQMMKMSDEVLKDKKKTPDTSHNEITSFKGRFDDVVSTLNEKQKLLISTEKRAAIGEIATGISHELNNPIGIIYGLTQRMLKNNGFSSSDKNIMETIFSETERCKLLLQQFLEYAKPIQLTLSVNNLNKMIRDTVDTILIQENNTYINFNIILPEE